MSTQFGYQRKHGYPIIDSMIDVKEAAHYLNDIAISMGVIIDGEDIKAFLFDSDKSEWITDRPMINQRLFAYAKEAKDRNVDTLQDNEKLKALCEAAAKEMISARRDMVRNKESAIRSEEGTASDLYERYEASVIAMGRIRDEITALRSSPTTGDYIAARILETAHSPFWELAGIEGAHIYYVMREECVVSRKDEKTGEDFSVNFGRLGVRINIVSRMTRGFSYENTWRGVSNIHPFCSNYRDVFGTICYGNAEDTARDYLTTSNLSGYLDLLSVLFTQVPPDANPYRRLADYLPLVKVPHTTLVIPGDIRTTASAVAATELDSTCTWTFTAQAASGYGDIDLAAHLIEPPDEENGPYEYSWNDEDGEEYTTDANAEIPNDVRVDIEEVSSELVTWRRQASRNNETTDRNRIFIENVLRQSSINHGFSDPGPQPHMFYAEDASPFRVATIGGRVFSSNDAIPSGGVHVDDVAQVGTWPGLHAQGSRAHEMAMELLRRFHVGWPGYTSGTAAQEQPAAAPVSIPVQSGTYRGWDYRIQNRFGGIINLNDPIPERNLGLDETMINHLRSQCTEPHHYEIWERLMLNYRRHAVAIAHATARASEEQLVWQAGSSLTIEDMLAANRDMAVRGMGFAAVTSDGDTVRMNRLPPRVFVPSVPIEPAAVSTDDMPF